MFSRNHIQLAAAACLLIHLVGPSPVRSADAGLQVTAMFPKQGAKDVCPDTPLRLTFSGAPVAGAGKIQVFAVDGDALIESIDVAEPTKIKTIGGFSNFKYYPVLISGNEAALYLPDGALDYGKTYYVKIDSGA